MQKENEKEGAYAKTESNRNQAEKTSALWLDDAELIRNVDCRPLVGRDAGASARYARDITED
jgi:hypothetical protein